MGRDDVISLLLSACKAAELALETIESHGSYPKGELIPRTRRMLSAAIVTCESRRGLAEAEDRLDAAENERKGA